MKVGDLVRYRGWKKAQGGLDPLAIVLEVKNSDSEYHTRVRVMWLGDEVPIQAQVLSVDGNRISSWCAPKYFEVLVEEYQQNQDVDAIWEHWGDQ